jgi:hypothetical protein
MNPMSVPPERGLRWLQLLFLAACVWVAAYHLLVNILPYEDAWITYRIADNLAAGRGWATNPGEAVQGATSPLYTLWIAAGRLLMSETTASVISVRGNLIFYLLTAWLLVRTVSRLTGSRRLGTAAGILFAVNPAMIALSSGGKEMFLFTALALGSLEAAGRGRFPLAAGLVSLGLLARPEAVLAGLIVLGLWVRAGRPRPAATALWLAVPAGIWAVFAIQRFGHLLPQPLIAKLLPVYPVPPGNALLSIARWLGDWSAPAGFPEGSGVRNLLAFLLAEAGALGLVLDPDLRRRGGAALAIFLQLLILFYGLGNPLLFDWYLAGIFVAWLPAILVGVPAFGTALARRLPAGAPARALRLGSLGVAWIVLLGGILVPLGGDAWLGRSPMEAARSAIRLRCKAYREAALWLNGIAAPGSTLASPESGALGSAWSGRLLDTSGLVSPEALEFLPVPEDLRPDPATGAVPISVPVELIRRERPDYVAVLSVFAEKTLLRDPWFLEAYRPLRKVPLPKPVWGSGSVHLMQRADLPAPVVNDRADATDPAGDSGKPPAAAGS